jgi:rhodanese-related sulfurtransferase
MGLNKRFLSITKILLPLLNAHTPALPNKRFFNTIARIHKELINFMNIKTKTMTKSLVVIAWVLFVAGCQFQKPDYVQMISPATLNRTMQNEDIFLVDVHTPEQRHIKGTDLFIPYNDIAKYREKLPEDKNTAIYLYCEGGPMGNAAARSLYELGYRNLFNLEGGAKAWKKEGLDFE